MGTGFHEASGRREFNLGPRLCVGQGHEWKLGECLLELRLCIRRIHDPTNHFNHQLRRIKPKFPSPLWHRYHRQFRDLHWMEHRRCIRSPHKHWCLVW